MAQPTHEDPKRIIRPHEQTQGRAQETHPSVSPETTEQPSMREDSRELNHEQEQSSSTLSTSSEDSLIEQLSQKLRKQKKKKIVVPPGPKDEITKNIEKIMEEGLVDAFRAMTPVQQQEFKIKGEEVAVAIRTLLSKAKIKVRAIIKLLLEWLRMIPGVNTLYLEQEAKIKADRIIHLKNIMNNDKHS